MKTLQIGCLLLAGALVSCSSEEGTVDAQTKSGAETATEGAAGLADEATIEKAQGMLDQALAHIKDNKTDLAEKALAKLDELKASLPESLQSKIDAARKQLAALKQAGIKLPGQK